MHLLIDALDGMLGPAAQCVETAPQLLEPLSDLTLDLASRFAGLFLAVWILSILPHLVLMFGTVLSATDPVAGLGEAAPDVPRVLAVTLQASLLLSAVGAVISAWTPRRAYATAGVIAALIIPSVIALIVVELAVSDLARLIVLLSPPDLVDGFNAAVFGTLPDGPGVTAADLPGWAYVAASVFWIVVLIAAVVRRYQVLSV